ncbi:hypothetical protein K501DRAFT_273414 [Backusella circina FSU 941]|nr:hypothetical protein K501DRAFT_273414 [Backusella circina FSU 941]
MIESPKDMNTSSTKRLNHQRIWTPIVPTIESQGEHLGIAPRLSRCRSSRVVVVMLLLLMLSEIREFRSMHNAEGSFVHNVRKSHFIEPAQTGATTIQKFVRPVLCILSSNFYDSSHFVRVDDDGGLSRILILERSIDILILERSIIRFSKQVCSFERHFNVMVTCAERITVNSMGVGVNVSVDDVIYQKGLFLRVESWLVMMTSYLPTSSMSWGQEKRQLCSLPLQLSL